MRQQRLHVVEQRVGDAREWLVHADDVAARRELTRLGLWRRGVLYRVVHAGRVAVTGCTTAIRAATPSATARAAACCGGAGIYNLSEPEMSEALLSDKIAKVKATGADLLVIGRPILQADNPEAAVEALSAPLPGEHP